MTREDVDQRVDEQDQEEQDERVMQGCLHAPGREIDPEQVQAVERQGRVQERRRGVVDRRGHRHQADQVEPAGEPAPARAAELRRPVVDPARGRHRRRQLGHRERHQQDEAADHRPPDRDRDRTAVQPRLPVGGEAAREDRDDRERDREVGEPAPAAPQLLLVAELGEPLLVAAKRFGSGAHAPSSYKGLLNAPYARAQDTLAAPRKSSHKNDQRAQASGSGQQAGEHVLGAVQMLGHLPRRRRRVMAPDGSQDPAVLGV